MLRIFRLVSLWTSVLAVVVSSTIATTVPVIITTVTPATTSSPSQTIAQSDCFFTTLPEVGGKIASVCSCGPSNIPGINLAVSGSATTSYCALGGPVQSGYSQVHALDGQPFPTAAAMNSTNGPSLTVASSATSKHLPTNLTTFAITTVATMTAEETGSGTYRHGAAVCFGLISTALVAILML